MMMTKKYFLCILSCFVAGVTGVAAAQSAVFVVNGQLVLADTMTSRVVDFSAGELRSATDAPERVADYWGSLEDGRLLVTLEHSHDPAEHTPTPEARSPGAAEETDPDHTCSTSSPGKPAVLISADGSRGAEVSPSVLRAYPAPAGNRIAIISPDRDLQLWEDDRLTTVSAPGRVSNAGWSPDGQRLVVSVYPPDWSEGAVSSALTTAEFLRLQNADLYMYDVNRREFVTQLTNDPGTEYGAFFSEDGTALYYVWLHLTEDRGGLMRMNLDLDGHTSASAPAVQLTTAGEDQGETPLGRVTTYLWNRASSQLVFEAGRPDGSGVIWAMTADGKTAAPVAPGRKPQRLSDGQIIFQDSAGALRMATPEVHP